MSVFGSAPIKKEYYAYMQKKNSKNARKRMVTDVISGGDFRVPIPGASADGGSRTDTFVSWQKNSMRNVYSIIAKDMKREYEDKLAKFVGSDTNLSPVDAMNAVKAVGQTLNTKSFHSKEFEIMYEKMRGLMGKSYGLQYSLDKVISDGEKGIEEYRKRNEELNKELQEILDYTSKFFNLGPLEGRVESNTPIGDPTSGNKMMIKNEALVRLQRVVKRVQASNFIEANLENITKDELKDLKKSIFIDTQTLNTMGGFLYEGILAYAITQAADSLVTGAELAGTENVSYGPGVKKITGKVDVIARSVTGAGFGMTAKAGSITGQTIFHNTTATNSNFWPLVAGWSPESMLYLAWARMNFAKTNAIDSNINQFLAATLASFAIAGPPGTDSRAQYLVTADAIIPVFEYVEQMANGGGNLTFSGASYNEDATNQLMRSYVNNRKQAIDKTLAMKAISGTRKLEIKKA